MDELGGQSATLVAEPPSTTFRDKYYSTIRDEDWNSWYWQLRHRWTEGLSRVIQLTDDESNAMDALRTSGRIAASITPYYLSLISPTDPDQPLRRTVIPTMAELNISYGESSDPLHEDIDSPVPGVVHRYNDRALMLLSDQCASYCRYCTRSRLVGAKKSSPCRDPEKYNAAFDYIRNNENIRDVIISGGDPLLLDDGYLERILYRLRGIPHVEIIRIGTKAPVTLPQRITPDLCEMLRKYHPLFISIHFTHPDECTPECTKACEMLADAGIPLGSQTVLLAGINDNIETMASLMHKLLMMRVRPYYLYQCDPIAGTAHFRTPVSKGIEIIDGLRGHTSGYAVPTFVIDAPGGGGKIPLQRNYVVSCGDGQTTLMNFRGEICHYP